VLLDAVRRVLDGPAFAAPLPPGYADQPATIAGAVAERLGELQERLGKHDPVEVAEAAARKFRSSRPPILTGQLGQILGLDQVSDTTMVWRRAGSVCDLRVDDGTPSLELGDRRIIFPAWMEPALRALLTLLERERFTAADLAGELDPESRLVLIRRLVREGLLEFEVVA
jgi:hypothetical protein